MRPVARQAVATASPSTIWKTCFADMQWEKWDPDVSSVEDVEGGLRNGGKFTFVMKKDNQRAPCVLSDVIQEKCLTFSGSLGPVKYKGIIELTPMDASTTSVNYSFGLYGFLGLIVGYLAKKDIVKGTEGGLHNIVKLSEEAQTKTIE